MLRSLEGDHSQVEYSKLIFDDIYKNSYEKEKLAGDDKFYYYKTLSRIRNRLRQQHHGMLGDVFDHHIEAKRIPIPLEPRRSEPQTAGYNILKINNRLFKIHKAQPPSSGRKPQDPGIRPQSQTLSFRPEISSELESNVRNRLEDIVHRHRSLQRKYKLKKQENTVDVLPKEYRSLDPRKTSLSHRR